MTHLMTFDLSPATHVKNPKVNHEKGKNAGTVTVINWTYIWSYPLSVESQLTEDCLASKTESSLS